MNYKSFQNISFFLCLFPVSLTPRSLFLLYPACNSSTMCPSPFSFVPSVFIHTQTTPQRGKLVLRNNKKIYIIKNYLIYNTLYSICVFEWSPLACQLCLVFYMALLIIMLLILSKRPQGQMINLGTVSLKTRLSLLSHSHFLHLQEIKLRLALLFSLLLSIIVKNYLLVFFLNRAGRRAIRQEIMAWRLAEQTLHYNASRLD